MPRAQINFPIDSGRGGIVTPSTLQASFTVALNLSPICVQRANILCLVGGGVCRSTLAYQILLAGQQIVARRQIT